MQLDLDEAVDFLIENIKDDYLTYSLRGEDELSDIGKTMVSEFNNGFEVRPGKKYIKIINRNSVWGFVVATNNDSKFSKGTILKAAGWATPARNHGRGNVFDGGYTIMWTGPLHM